MLEYDVGGVAEASDQPHEPAQQAVALQFKVSVEDAEYLKAQAAVHRAAAASGGTPLNQAENLARAIALDVIADQASDDMGPVRHGIGGEVAIRFALDAPWKSQQIGHATTNHPALVAAEASVERLKLARDANCLSLAADVAERHGAISPSEQVLAHQIAASHQLAMKLVDKSQAFLSREFLTYKQPFQQDGEAQREQVASIEAVRCATAAARMMEATARAAMALDRLRNGSTQTIVVQQKVEVSSGGQAIVAGTLDVGRPKKKRSR